MFNFFRSKKATKEEKEDTSLIQKKALEQQHINADASIAEATLKMTSKKCPFKIPSFYDTNKCSIDCVHFKEGYHWDFDWDMHHNNEYDTNTHIIHPSCKLWK